MSRPIRALAARKPCFRGATLTHLFLGVLFLAGGCADPKPPGAIAVPIEANCSDGRDNDGDGQGDCDDLDCQSPGGECKAAPPVDRTVSSTLAETAVFLYSGDNPLQKDADVRVFDPKRIAMLRGRLVDESGSPLASVRVSVNGHKEYGYTLSRGDGQFDLAVNGGARLLLDFVLEGYLPLQRTVQPGWQRYLTLPVAGLIEGKGPEAKIESGSAATQTMTGAAKNDALGEREPFLVFEPGTRATAVFDAGNEQGLSQITVGVSEYPIGSGHMYSPGSPSNLGGAAYGLEFVVKEASDLGARHVAFSKPASLFVENYLELPVGAELRLKHYDRALGQWEPSRSGQVIAILDVPGGVASVDVRGDAAAADEGTLGELGITRADREQLAARYAPGTTLMHAEVKHFSGHELEPPSTAPTGAVAPTLQGSTIEPLDEPSRRGDAVVELQAASHRVDIAGTPYSLLYQSNRTLAYGPGRALELLVVGDSLPAGLRRVTSRVTIAGREFSEIFAPASNLRLVVPWDGKDAFGRLLQGPQRASVHIEFLYGAVVTGGSQTSSTSKVETVIPLDCEVALDAWDAKGYHFGGFSLDVLHAYDPALKRVYFGSGDQRSAENVALVTKPANKDSSFNLGTPDSLVVAPDGSLLITDDQQQSDTTPGRVLRIAEDGQASVSVGKGSSGAFAEPVMMQPQGIVASGDGSLVVVDAMLSAIRHIDTDGRMTTLVSGDPDDQPEVEYALEAPDGIALGPRDELYFVDGQAVMRLEAGQLLRIAGGGSETSDRIEATRVKLIAPSALGVTKDGSVYVSERGQAGVEGGHRVRRILPDGTITTVAGNGKAGYAGDGGVATAATLNGPRGVALGPDGSLYIVDQGNNRIRRVTPDGLIQTVIGGGKQPLQAGQLAVEVALNEPDGISVGPDGTLYIATKDNVIRIAPGLAELDETEHLVPSSDGRVLYRFDNRGKHLSTIDAMTGVTELTFGYDQAGYLASLEDKNGLETQLERDRDASLQAIVGPFGQRTELVADASGNAARVTDPLDRAVELTWDAAGLLSRVIDPRAGGSTNYGYDPTGRLLSVTDPTGYQETLSRNSIANGWSVAVTTPENQSTEYVAQNSAGENWQRSIKRPDRSELSWHTTASTRVIYAINGSTTQVALVPDTAFGAQAMLPSKITLTLPSGKTRVTYPMRTKGMADVQNALDIEDWYDEVEVNGRVYTSEFNRESRKLAVTSPMGKKVTTILDELGRPTRASAAGRPTTEWQYDARGRVKSIAQISGNETRVDSYDYGDAGWLIAATNPLAEQASYGRDAVGRLTSLTRPDAAITRWSLNAADQVTALTPPAREAHRFDYSATANLLSADTPPTGAANGTSAATGTPAAGFTLGQQMFSYGKNMELLSVDRSDGSGIDYTYDYQRGALTSQKLTHATVTFDYQAGQLTRAARSDGANLTMTYDGPLWTSSSWTGAITGNVKANYDTNLWLSSMTVNDVSTVGFKYDEDGLLIGASATAGAMTITRDVGSGFVTGTVLGNVTTAQSCNGYAELLEFSSAMAGAALFQQSMDRDALGRITHLVETVQGTKHESQFEYDSAGRLVAATRDGVKASYAYDQNGNRTSVSAAGASEVAATFDAQDRILTNGTTAYEHTAHGDLKKRADATKSLAVVYDELGNLLNATMTEGATTKTIEYIVDGLGRRVARRIDGQFDRAWLYRDALRPIAEIDAAGVITHYVYLGQDGAPDMMIRSGVAYRIVKDHLGSVRLVVNTQSGAVAQSVEYDAYGRVLSETGAGFQAFGFAGGIYDAATKLVRFGARDYDAEIGRWTNRDPIGLAGQRANVYVYVGGEPVNMKDLGGLADFFYGGEADLVVTGGVSIGAGFVLDTDHLSESGVYFAFGKGAGLNVGVGVGGGVCVRDIEGDGAELDINGKSASVQAVADDRGVCGYAISVGPGIGVSATETKTSTLTIGNIAQAVGIAAHAVAGWFR